MQPDPARGVFETMLARDGRVQALAAHLRRLAGSVTELYGCDLPPDLGASVAAQARDLSEPHRVRVEVVPAGGEIDTTTSATPVPPGLTDPVALEPVFVPGGFGRHKWIDRGFLQTHRSALLIDGDELLEGAWANVWLLEGDRVVTPPADGRILPGVTRSMLLQLAPSLGLEAREEPISLARATGAEAIFLTSAVRHVVAAALLAVPNEHPQLPRIRDALAALQ